MKTSTLFDTHAPEVIKSLRDEIDVWHEQIVNRQPWCDIEEVQGQYVLAPEQHKHVIAQTKQAGVPDHFPVSRATRTMLVNLGYKPASIMTEYDWPGFTPRKVQVVTASYFTRHQRCWNTNGLRSGKTLSAVWALMRLLTLSDIKRVLIIAPLSIVNEAWGDTLQAVDPFGSTHVLTQSGKQARKILKEQPRIVVTNPSRTRYMKNELIEYNPDLVVVDEATVYKNAEAQQTEGVRELIQVCNAMLWSLTATPITKLGTDIWPLGSLIDSDMPGYYSWRSKVCARIPGGRNRGFYPLSNEVVIPLARKHMTPVLGYPTPACIDLPPQEYIGAETTLTPAQEKALADLDEKKATVIDGRWIDSYGRGKKQKLIQILAGAVRVGQTGDEADDFAIVDCFDRVKLLVDMVEQERASEGKKVLIFCAFTGGQYVLQENLAKSGVPTLVLNGTVKGGKREAMLKKFREDPDIFGLIVHPEIGQFGLDLSIANVSIWFIPPLTVSQWLQANGRAQGPRSVEKERTIIRYIFATAWEKAMYQRLAKMQATAVLATSPAEKGLLA